MHHMYPVSKGDQLCPLGFHPQVRWPTRCKRCFRDYKEHGGKRMDDVAASSPSLSDTKDRQSGRSWTSTSNLSTLNNGSDSSGSGVGMFCINFIRATYLYVICTDLGHLGPSKRPSSWTSTPDLEDKARSRHVDQSVDVNMPIPRRRHTTTLDIGQVEESFTLKRPPIPPASKETSEDLVILRTDSLAERARKMQLLKKQSSVEREMSRERSLPRSIERLVEMRSP